METTATVAAARFDDADISVLKTLISADIDSSKLFKTASDETSDQKLKVFFAQGANARVRFADEFKHLLAVSGGEPASDGSLAGFIHNWWVDVRELLTHHESHAILDEAVRGEEALKSTYEDNFSKVHSLEIREILERQYSEIKQVITTLAQLRDAKRPDRPNA